ncbi:MAG: type III-A CRISPR-associated RAMP protein Csm5 [Desulfurococcales archaeon]|jgi:CRISPR-associated protein Csm5|nr:type III-A CRISPR-associated RAMP protein Csm5 [Desulfurococcales archaeon]
MLGEIALTLSLEPVTPLHVSSNRESIVGVDAILEGDQVVFIDLESSLIDLDPRVLDKILNVAFSKEGFYRLTETLRREGRLTPLFKAVAKTKLSNGARVRLMQRMIVPGSTLKGYIRTAILYELLRNIQDPKKILDEKIRKNLPGDPRYVAQDLEKYLLRTLRLPKQGGFVDAFANLIVSDPVVERYELAVREMRVIERATEKAIATIFMVTLESGLLRYDIRISRPFNIDKIVMQDDVRSRMQDILERLGLIMKIIRDDPSDLIRILSEYGCRHLREELERTKNLGKPSIYKIYINKLEELEKLCRSTPSNCAPARIGFGTGHEAKTIALYLKDVYPDLYNDLRKQMSNKIGRIWDSLTLKAVTEDGFLIGVGWCRICRA